MTETTTAERPVIPLEKLYKHKNIHVLQTAIAGLAGFSALLYPLFGSVLETTLLGWLMVGNGAAIFLTLFVSWKLPFFWVRCLSVVTSALLGFFTVIHLSEAKGLVVGMLVVFLGLEALAQLFLARHVSKVASRNILYASAMIALIVAMFMNILPDPTATQMALCLGIALICEAFAMMRLLLRGP
ncbi:MAG: hypothetical protein ABJO67_11960 [Pseudoruegeria sp.]